jgi:hypothetical protein
MAEEVTINSELALAEYIRDLRAAWLKDHYIIATHRTGKQRTLTQNRALHLWLGMLADQLNASGMDMRKTLRHDVELPWSVETCKEFLWRPIQEAVLRKESTTEANRIEYSQVFEVLAHHMAIRLGVTVPEWPRKNQQEAA